MTDHLRLMGTTGEIVFDGGMTLPAVMGVGNLAWQAQGLSQPELVPADVLCADPDEWIGKPVTLGHPESGSVTTADWLGLTDTPVVGRIASARVKDEKLHSEIAIYEQRMAALTENLDSSQPVMNVSIGVRAMTDPGAGGVDKDGRAYSGKWSRLTHRDHLALLPHSTGACSTTMGAGFPRAAEKNRTIADKERTMTSETLADLVGKLTVEQVKGMLSKDVLAELSAKPSEKQEPEPPADPPKAKDEQKVNQGETPEAVALKKLTEQIEAMSAKLAGFDRVAEAHQQKEDLKKAELIERLIQCKLYEKTDEEALGKRSIESLEREVRAAQHNVPTSLLPPFQSLNMGPRQDPDKQPKGTKTARSFAEMLKKKSKGESA